MNSVESQIEVSANEEDNHAQYAMQLASASVLPMVLKVVVELGVLDIIGRAGPGALLSPSQIVSQLPVEDNPEAPLILDRILCLLASHFILTCSLATNQHDGSVYRLYGLAPVAKYFVRNQDGGSLAPLLDVIQGKVMVNVWYHLKDAVKGGFPFNSAYGMNARENAGKDAGFGELFKGAMRDFSHIFMEKFLDMYKGFEGLKSLVDVGGGDGSVLNMIVSRYPTIKGINYDLAPVIDKSPSYPGIEHVAGDMFGSVPKGDTIFMKWILHFWDDEHCVILLKNCYEALPANGKVIAVDFVIPEDPAGSLAFKSLFQLYLFMLNMNPMRKERTEREFESLAKEAGFSHIQVACCAYNYSVVEFYKNM